VILGIDPGTKRVGIAAADLETRFARPVEVVPADAAVGRIVSLVDEIGATTIVIGRPLSMSGVSGPAVDSYLEFGAQLRASLPAAVEVVEFDERLTSVIAERQLRSAGVKAKDSRAKVDAVAAQVMLQGYLDRTKRDAWP
jgi:putative Holliday junction resolvase